MKTKTNPHSASEASSTLADFRRKGEKSSFLIGVFIVLTREYWGEECYILPHTQLTMKEGNELIPALGEYTTAVHPAAGVFSKCKTKPQKMINYMH